MRRTEAPADGQHHGPRHVSRVILDPPAAAGPPQPTQQEAKGNVHPEPPKSLTHRIVRSEVIVV